jgi:hypothetical protein
MQAHFRHLRFNIFPMIWKTPQCEVFWPLQSNFEVLGVPADSQVPISGVWVSSSHSLQSRVATFQAHHAQILLCFGPRASIWLIIQLNSPNFQFFSPIFSTSFQTQFGLPHISITSLPQCVCPHPINPMGIHLLHCTYGNEHMKTYNVVHDTFVAITQDVNFHVGWKQLHAFPSTTFNSSCQ